MPELARPEVVRIAQVVPEADEIVTIYLDHQMEARPGQFVMVWIPGLDEKPFAISYLQDGLVGITVASVGPFTRALCAMGPGTRVGVRGPYGTAYQLEGGRAVMVGGGYGSASLALLAEQAVEEKIEVTFILGARTRAALVFEDRLRGVVSDAGLIVTTDDGSHGERGLVTGPLSSILETGGADAVFACGPDRMLKAVTDLCVSSGVPGQLSLERWMKCGYGLCGHCAVDPLGLRVCTEGPVVASTVAAQISELGLYHRAKSSKKHPV